MNGISEIETPQEMIDYYFEENESVLEMIKNQLIVFLFTIYLIIIQYTMKCLICDSPERILKLINVYPNYEEQRAFIFLMPIAIAARDSGGGGAVILQNLRRKLISQPEEDTIVNISRDNGI